MGLAGGGARKIRKNAVFRDTARGAPSGTPGIPMDKDRRRARMFAEENRHAPGDASTGTRNRGILPGWIFFCLETADRTSTTTMLFAANDLHPAQLDEGVSVENSGTALSSRVGIHSLVTDEAPESQVLRPLAPESGWHSGTLAAPTVSQGPLHSP